MKAWPVIILLIIAAGCTWQSDSGAPEIYTHTPSQGASYISGEPIDFEMTAVDDWALASVSFAVIPSFDSLWVESRTLPGWQVNGDTTFGGSTLFWNGKWDVPDSIAEGTYALTWEARDAKGKLSATDLTFSVTSSLDTLAPEIDSFFVADTLLVGQNWDVHVSASDDLSLSYCTLLFLQDNTEIWREEKVVMDTVVVWDQTFADPGAVGSYELKLVIRDWVNKMRSQTVKVVFE